MIDDESMIRLINLANETSLIILDRTLRAVRRSRYGRKSFASVADSLNKVCVRAKRATMELVEVVKLNEGGDNG